MLYRDTGSAKPGSGLIFGSVSGLESQFLGIAYVKDTFCLYSTTQDTSCGSFRYRTRIWFWVADPNFMYQAQPCLRGREAPIEGIVWDVPFCMSSTQQKFAIFSKHNLPNSETKFCQSRHNSNYLLLWTKEKLPIQKQLTRRRCISMRGIVDLGNLLTTERRKPK